MSGKMEDAAENGAVLQTEQTPEGIKDPYEAQGARPKQKLQSPQKEQWSTYPISFIQCFRPEVREMAHLEISENNLTFTGFFTSKQESKDVRLVSKFQYEAGKECIHLSFYNNTADCVSDIFFDTTAMEECLAQLQDLLYRKLQPHVKTVEDMAHATRVLKKQPIYIGWSRVTLGDKSKESEVKMEPPPVDATEYLVILDLECVSCYLMTSIRNKPITPEVQLMFWEKETPKSIETVKHHHGQNFIFLESSQQSMIMEAKEDIVLNLRILRPKKVNFMQDVEEFLAYIPQIEPDMPFFMRDEQPHSNNAAVSWGANAGVDPVPRRMFQDTSKAGSEVTAFRADLEYALDHFKDNDDFQNIWITQQFDLEELVQTGMVPKTDSGSGVLSTEFKKRFISSCLEGKVPTTASSSEDRISPHSNLCQPDIGPISKLCFNVTLTGQTLICYKVPKTDSRSGGLDPNSGEHFKKALMDIADHLKEGEIPTAMSRVVAVREVFSESAVLDIRVFLQDFNNIEILKRLYFKSLVQ